jgi:hypothetical protein
LHAVWGPAPPRPPHPWGPPLLAWQAVSGPHQVTLQAACQRTALICVIIKGRRVHRCNGVCSDSVYWFHGSVPWLRNAMIRCGGVPTWPDVVWEAFVLIADQVNQDVVSVGSAPFGCVQCPALSIDFIQLWTGNSHRIARPSTPQPSATPGGERRRPSHCNNQWTRMKHHRPCAPRLSRRPQAINLWQTTHTTADEPSCRRYFSQRLAMLIRPRTGSVQQ